MSYKNDLYIINQCLNNDEYKCKCLNPPTDISKLSKVSISPYYCWYQPCKDSDTLKTSLLTEEIKLCNNTLCSIHLGEVVIENGFIDVTNDCASSLSLINTDALDINSDYNTRTTPTNVKLLMPIIYPSIIFMLCCLIYN